MKKHAYLVLAHNNFYNLEKLLKLLDYKDCDIYLHIDNKNKRFPNEKFYNLIKNANLYIYSEFKTNWGGFSLIECELFLLKQAFSKREYQYYHLLSGADLPIKKHSEIVTFFEKNEGYEFVQYADEAYKKDKKVVRRVKYYHFIQEYRKRSSKKLIRGFLTFLSKSLLGIQMLLQVDRMRRCDYILKYGSQWFSITGGFVKYLLEQEEFIYKTFSNTMCSDELVVQTVLYNSPFKNKIYQYINMDSEEGNMREINWSKNTDPAHPYIWNEYDFEELMNSKMLFARKFDENVDKEIIDKIYTRIKE